VGQFSTAVDSVVTKGAHAHKAQTKLHKNNKFKALAQEAPELV
jgi:hypothetical protein